MKKAMICGLVGGVLASVLVALAVGLFSQRYEILRQADYEIMVDAFCEDDVECLIELH